MAASAATNGVDGEVIWKGLALAVYIAGLSWLARKESGRVKINYLPCVLLAAPIFIAGCIDDGVVGAERGDFFGRLGGLVNLGDKPQLGEKRPTWVSLSSRLLAGMVLVDLLAVAGAISPWVACLPCGSCWRFCCSVSFPQR